MRPGPDVPVLAGPVTITPVVTAEFKGASVIIPAWDVQVEASADRAVQTRVTFSAPHEYVPASWDAPLACFGQRVHIAARLASPRGEWDVQVGVYQIESWEESNDGHVAVVALLPAFDLVHADLDVPLAAGRGEARSNVDALAEAGKRSVPRGGHVLMWC